MGPSFLKRQGGGPSPVRAERENFFDYSFPSREARDFFFSVIDFASCQAQFFSFLVIDLLCAKRGNLFGYLFPSARSARFFSSYDICFPRTKRDFFTFVQLFFFNRDPGMELRHP